MDENRKAEIYLEKNRLLHIGMLEALKRGKAEIIEATDTGVLLFDENSKAHMLSVKDFEYGKVLLDKIKNPYEIVVCGDLLTACIKEKFRFSNTFRCKKVAYFSKKKLALETSLRIVRPKDCQIQKIKAHYHTIPEAEIDEIQRRGNLFCAFAAEDFVGYAGNHLDGSLGLLEIFPEFQGKGYGEALERFMVNYILDKGEIPYGEVVEGNLPSERLQRKLGFQVSDERITWFL